MNHSELTLEVFRKYNIARCKEAFPECDNWKLNDWATALAGEVGELCNLLKKLRRGEIVGRKEIAREMADILTYLDLIANAAGIDLAEATVEKFNEVSDRRNCSIKLNYEVKTH